ncbi:diacylglycerol/lipid kinase family protein [Kocuria tytonis]|uniref:Diacylglycerol kinase family lipid kinase n=1 Tax=Kocuria tytonis TaxID=2054280 RepID=A0A495A2E8_9MICC|nr:diacylglycerol kinase family protein [Kocuria tytonis]RKQ33682.1 diacylglycerol kinase family lipid kinase [Kocuria tytonis]
MPEHTWAPQRVAVVVNPSKALAHTALDAVIIACRKAGWADPACYETTVADPGFSMARQAVEDGADVVLAAGGDGTIRAVGESLVGGEIPLGLVPLGTGNLLARNLQADLADPHHSVDVALFGSEKAIDTVSMHLETAEGRAQDHRFLVMGGAGFDAQIMADTKDDLKDLVGWVAYGEAGLRHLFNGPRWARFSVDGGAWESRLVRSVMVCNCGELTAGLILVPRAKLDDGFLDLVVMSPRSVVGWLGMAAKLVFRHRHELPVIDYYSGKNVRVEFHEPIESEVDGDPLGSIKAFETTLDHKSLKVRVPPSQAD